MCGLNTGKRVVFMYSVFFQTGSEDCARLYMNWAEVCIWAFVDANHLQVVLAVYYQSARDVQ